MSEKLSSVQPNFLVPRKSGVIDVMVPTGRVNEVTRLDSEGRFVETRFVEMRSQTPLEPGSNEYDTKLVAEAAMTPDVQMALGEQLAGVEPMSDHERQERRGYVARGIGEVVLASVIDEDEAQSAAGEGLIEVPSWAKVDRADAGVGAIDHGAGRNRRVVVDRVSNPTGVIGHPSNELSEQSQAYGEHLRKAKENGDDL